MQLSGLLLLLAAAAPSTTDEERAVDALIARTPNIVAPPTLAQKTAVGQTVPVIQRSVTSSARPEDLKSFFKAEFMRKGLYIAPEQDKFSPEKGMQVTGLDTETLVAYMALFQPAGKLTTVVIAAANVGKPANEAATTHEPIAPLFPGAHSVTTYHVEVVKGMTYSCPGTPAEIKKFYREQYGKLGYKETEDMVFLKQNSRVWIIVSPGVSERSVAVYLQTAPEGGQVQGQIPTLFPPDIKVPQEIKPEMPTAKPAGK